MHGLTCFLLKSFDMINFTLMLLSCCNGKDDEYKPGQKNTCFSVILNERKKYHKRLIQLELNFLLPEQRMKEINKNDAVLVLFLVGFFVFFSQQCIQLSD